MTLRPKNGLNSPISCDISISYLGPTPDPAAHSVPSRHRTLPGQLRRGSFLQAAEAPSESAPATDRDAPEYGGSPTARR